MRITLNGASVDAGSTRLGDLVHGGTVLINGRSAPPDAEVREGDSVVVLDGTENPLLTSLREIYGPEVYRRVRGASIGVAGLGGIGSHVALALARAGVGSLVIADFDSVDVTNLARQCYFSRDVGLPKAEAMAGMIADIGADTSVEAHVVRLDADNAVRLFSGCDVVCEAFDRPDQKAMLVEALLSGDPGVRVVSCSGMAGFGPASEITTQRRMSRLSVCGDMESDSSQGSGLVAPRVMVCAGHEALEAVRILLGL